ncbi:beta-lactamase family protein [bacterium SCSIO 12741]|nr:beta-lactamase family protein [bacterium SCSIO 12741]
MKSILLSNLLIAGLILLAPSCKKKDQNITTTDELSEALTEIHDFSQVPGFAVSVVKDNQLVYQQSFGSANLEQRSAFTNQTSLPIGSISKTFIGIAVIRAIEEGYFTLETDINSILPFTVRNPKNPEAIIRVKHLVTHTSGLMDNQQMYLKAYYQLPDDKGNGAGAEALKSAMGMQMRDGVSLEEYLRSYYLPNGKYYSLDNFSSEQPGSKWRYSNVASSLCAFLVESATEMPFKEYVKTKVLAPLSMSSSSYYIENQNPNQLATLYWDRKTPLPPYANDSYPDGSLYTTNDDLAKYLLEMVNQGSKVLQSNESYNQLFKPQLASGVVPASMAQNQGTFWFINDQQLTHDGGDPGISCHLEFNQRTGFGYLILTNMDASTPDHKSEFHQFLRQVRFSLDQFSRN